MADKTPEVAFKLKQTRLHQGEAKIRWWYAIIEEGTPYEELFKPVFWDIHAYKFALGDFIRVEPDEGHYTADLKVVSTGVGGVRVQEYYRKDWGARQDTPAISTQYRTKWAGPHHKWRVERIADNHIEQSGFDTEAMATLWMAQNIKPIPVTAARAAA